MKWDIFKQINISYKHIRIIAVCLIIILIASVGFVCYKNLFYYEISTEKEWYEGRAFDIYSADQETLKQETLLSDEIEIFNNAHENKEVKNEMQAVRIAQDIARLWYDGCYHEQPFLIRFNQNASAWIVHGNIHKFPKNMLGGTICVAIDKQTGNVLFVQHTL